MKFDSQTTCILYGTHLDIVQRMLDYDYLCGRNSSISAVMSSGSEGRNYKVFYGDKEFFIPRISSREEVSQFPSAKVLINLASFRSASIVNRQAIESMLFDSIFTIAEGIPERESRELFVYEQNFFKQTGHHTTLFGPAIVGGLFAGVLRVGNTGGSIENIIKAGLYRKGSVGIVSKSGGMMNELMHIASRYSDGTHTALQIGGDRYPMSSFKTIINMYEKNNEITTILMLGEVGNESENQIADMIRDGHITKPIIARCCGTSASELHTDIQFGHAGAKANTERETAEFKNNNLREAGAMVPSTFDDIGILLTSLYSNCLIEKNSKSINNKTKIITSRQKTLFSSTISDERGEELLYNNIPVSKFVEQASLAKVIGHLWLKKELPDWACKFITTVLVLLADHGPAVSGAITTKIAARAGKDLVSSLVTGLLTIGPRFGGAITDAAQCFWKARQAGLSPEEFVESMKQQGIIIPGIGHKIKSIYNPDKRCELLKTIFNPYDINVLRKEDSVLSFGLQVEQITTQKKTNLILNVDGHIAAMLIDMMILLDMTDSEITGYIDSDFCNGLFVAARTIGFIGHYLDEQRLQEGLFRMPESHLLYG